MKRTQLFQITLATLATVAGFQNCSSGFDSADYSLDSGNGQLAWNSGGVQPSAPNAPSSDPGFSQAPSPMPTPTPAPPSTPMPAPSPAPAPAPGPAAQPAYPRGQCPDYTFRLIYGDERPTVMRLRHLGQQGYYFQPYHLFGGQLLSIVKGGYDYSHCLSETTVRGFANSGDDGLNCVNLAQQSLVDGRIFVLTGYVAAGTRFFYGSCHLE